jgi:predicted dehydrogenase
VDAQIRWGILGAGGIAATVGADVAASASSRVVVVGSRDLGRARALAGTLGAPRAYGSYDELVIDPGVDVVYVATTHAQHHAAALAALRAGKPVLVEKPIALNARQGREIAALAAARHLLCLEGMWTRLNPAVRRVAQLVAAGEIGEVRTVRADLSHVFDYDPKHRLFDPEAGGGALLDLGVYAAAFAWLLLGRPDSVTAIATLAPTGVDAADSLWWTYNDGRSAQLTCSAVTDAGSTATVVGSEGWIDVAGPIFRTEEITVCTAAGSRTERHPLPVGHGYGLEVAEVEDLLAAGATDSAVMPLADSLGVLAVLDEARRQIGVRYPGEEE